MSEQTKKRYHFLDCAKGVAIISVVLVHLFASVAAVDSSVNFSAAIGFMSNYHLAVFFVVSGFLMGERESGPMGLRAFFVKRAPKRMMVYGVMSLIYLLGDLTITNILSTVTGFGISVLWFLPALALSEFFFLLIKRIKAVWVQICVSFAVALGSCFLGGALQTDAKQTTIVLQIAGYLLIVILRALVGQLFMEIGCLLSGLIKRTSRGQRIAATIICLAVGIAGCLFKKNADWRIMNITHPVLWLLAAAAMSVGMILFFHEIEKIRIRPLEVIGKESLLIMCTHMYFGTMSQSIDLGYRISALSPHAKTYVFWGTAIAALAATEALFILIKRQAYKF